MALWNKTQNRYPSVVWNEQSRVVPRENPGRALRVMYAVYLGDIHGTDVASSTVSLDSLGSESKALTDSLRRWIGIACPVGWLLRWDEKRGGKRDASVQSTLMSEDRESRILVISASLDQGRTAIKRMFCGA